MRLYLLTIFLIIVNLTLRSQSLKEITANKYYETLAFTKAATYYKELAEEKNAKPENIRRAAECYLHLNDHVNANKYYEALITKKAANADDIYNYAQSLKSLGNYTKANEYIKSLKSLNSYKKIVKSHTNQPNYYIDLKQDSSQYTLKDAGINTEENDFSPFVNQKTLYFTSSRRGSAILNEKFAWDNSYFLDQYQGKLENGKISDIKSMPKAIDSKYHDGPGIVSADGNTLYITRNNFLDKKIGKDQKKQVNLKIFISKKDSNGVWGKFESFPFNNDQYSVGHPAITQDGNIMYFVSDMPGGYGQTDLYETHLENGVWSQPKNLGQAINSEGREMFPHCFNDVLLFSSDGHAGLGGLDIYFAVPELDEFFEPQNLKYPINTQYDDFGYYQNDDNKTGYLSSNRSGGKGKDDIYSFTSLVPITTSYGVEGIAKDKYTLEPLSNTTIYLRNSDNAIIKTITTDETGYYQFFLSSENDYRVEGYNQNYLNAFEKINTNNPNSKILTKNLVLHPLGVYTLIGNIKDAFTKKEISDVRISIKDKNLNKEIFNQLTDSMGNFEKVLGKLNEGDNINYEIILEKKGYNNKTIQYTTVLGKQNIIKLNELLDLNLTPSDQTNSFTTNESTISVPIIYFDLDEYSIREDAKLELDNFANLLKLRSDIKIEISGNTDCRATNAYNMYLSQQRAKATAQYLLNKGISKSRMTLKWYGENNLATNCPCENTNESNCSEDQHQQNRRSNFRVISYKIDNSKKEGL